MRIPPALAKTILYAMNAGPKHSFLSEQITEHLFIPFTESCCQFLKSSCYGSATFPLLPKFLFKPCVRSPSYLESKRFSPTRDGCKASSSYK